MLFTSKYFKMQNKSLNEHYYKIKSATFSVLLHVGRKPLFGIYSDTRHKPGCTTNEDSFRLDFSVVRKKMNCTIHVAETKMLISCLVIVQLICAFDYAMGKADFLMPQLKLCLPLQGRETYCFSPCVCLCVCLSVCLSVTKSCPLYNLITFTDISTKLYTFAKHIETTCNAQEP